MFGTACLSRYRERHGLVPAGHPTTPGSYHSCPHALQPHDGESEKMSQPPNRTSSCEMFTVPSRGLSPYMNGRTSCRPHIGHGIFLPTSMSR